jgi:hypothetical protein
MKNARFRSFLPLLLLAFAAVPASASDFRTDRAVYLAACAACHGADGRGMPKSAVGFEEPLPDFTDCSFATREPDADWLAVAHAGGPVRGFSEMMPAFGAALPVEELQRALDHVRTFCLDARWPRGELNLPRPLFTEKAYPEDEAVYMATISAEGAGSIANEIIYERRIGPRGQVELIAPFSLAEPHAGGAWNGSIGDVALAYKRAFFHDVERGSVVAAAAEVILPTGDDAKGFGKGTTIFEPFLAWGQILSNDWFAHLQAGAEIPADSRRADREGFFRIALGRSFTEGTFGRTWSPMVEMLANRDLRSGAPIHWAAVPQFQVTLNTRQHIMANLGVRIPLDEGDGRKTEVAFYLLWDWFDGGLTEGW